MQVLVKRTGGFAGLTEELAQVDTKQLDMATAQQVENIVQSFGFFEQPATIVSREVGADRFSYEITVTEGDQKHTITFNDDKSPETEPLRKLVKAIVEK
jgi:hypothetical protein